MQHIGAGDIHKNRNKHEVDLRMDLLHIIRKSESAIFMPIHAVLSSACASGRNFSRLHVNEMTCRARSSNEATMYAWAMDLLALNGLYVPQEGPPRAESDSSLLGLA